MRDFTHSVPNIYRRLTQGMKRQAALVVALLAVVCWLECSAQPRAPTLDEKVRNLQDILLKRPVINLNMDKWKNYVKSSPRNYSMIVMFTALSSSVNCPICRFVFALLLQQLNCHSL